MEVNGVKNFDDLYDGMVLLPFNAANRKEVFIYKQLNN